MDDLLEVGDFRFRLDYQVVLVGMVTAQTVSEAEPEISELFDNGVDLAVVQDSLLTELKTSFDVPLLSHSELQALGKPVANFDSSWDLVELVHYQTGQLQGGAKILCTSREHAKSSRRLVELNRFLTVSGQD